jgi:hypothetical protein
LIHRHLIVVLAFAPLPLGLIGCGDREDIRVYDVPKLASAPPKLGATLPAATAGGTQRMLAAIITRGEETWNFKLMGPTPLIAAERDAFVKFIETLQFTPAKAPDGTPVSEPQWTLPPGWTAKPASGIRFATITIGEGGLEVGVFRLFGPDSGKVLPNVRRWGVEQLGLPSVTEVNLPQLTREITVAGQPATFVDITGPGVTGGTGMARPPGTGPGPVPRPPAAEPPEKLTAPAPEGWVADPNPSQFVITKYNLVKDGKTASLSISRAGGHPVANLNRWRKQIGLPEWDEDGASAALQAGKEVIKGEVSGDDAILVDLLGPETAGDKRERILGALVGSRTGEMWFFKFQGPADLVTAEKATFERFLKGVKLE